VLLAGCDEIFAWASRLGGDTVGSVGSDSTATGAVVAFLRRRHDGHDGEELWRIATPPFPRMTEPVPVNPNEWNVVFTKDGTTREGGWAYVRYRINSRTPAGIASEKLWDFCLNETVKGYRIVAAWDANDVYLEECQKSPAWIKFKAP